MSTGMFIIQGDELIEMEQQQHALDVDLQKWLARWRCLVPGDQIGGRTSHRVHTLSVMSCIPQIARIA